MHVKQATGASITRSRMAIPTYEVAAAEQAPIFYALRNNQNTRGNVYPVPMTDRLTDTLNHREYDAITLENEYIRVVVLPELGGRVYEGYDKVNDYHFVYKNSVIKPALIGLCGAWISGGIEFNWPQHHRPTTFLPVDALVEEGEGGEVTAWLGEIEPMGGTKALMGLSVRPGESMLRLKARIHNRTDMPQTFHWWANLAVHVNDDYQLKFPPDIDYITTHYKDYVSPFPVIKGEFARTGFGDGTDITWYKNIHAQCSFFIFDSACDFMGGYDHGRGMGTVHVADHNVSPGKKFFTWGTGEFGEQWQKNLTDEDGPYIEIMTGCYTDNQPDFCWLMPGETKTFTQHWFPIRGLPDLVNANTEGAVSLSVADGRARLAFNATMAHTGAVAVLSRGGEELLRQPVDISPAHPFSAEVDVGSATMAELHATLYDADGAELIAYAHRPPYFADKQPPRTHDEARAPETIATIEELYLEGLHIEQYRHFNLEPEPWYREALRRDPGDARCNIAMGRRELHRGEWEQARQHFQRAVERLTNRNPNPYDGEAHYGLGLALKRQGQAAKALAALHKAAWSYAWRAPALLEAAQLHAWAGEWAQAISAVEQALETDRDSLRLRFLLAALIRRQGDAAAASSICRETLAFDRLDYGALCELPLVEDGAGEAEAAWQQLEAVIAGKPQSWLSLAGDYLAAGLTDEAARVLERCPEYPMKHYYLGYLHTRTGDEQGAIACYRQAEASPMDYCFPARDADIPPLTAAMAALPDAARAPYYLGCLYYGRGNGPRALALWEEAVRRDEALWPAHRALALALHAVAGDAAGAKAHMEAAFHGDPTPRYLYELVQLWKRCRVPAEQRLALLDAHPQLTGQRDDLCTEHVRLMNITGDHDRADALLAGHSFQPYEGGEGQLVQQRILVRIVRGRAAMERGEYEEALENFIQALDYPENHHEGRRYRPREGHVHYHIGLALEAMGRNHEARASYERALGEASELDESEFYRGQALRKLGRDTEAAACYRAMLTGAADILARDGQLPYFGGFPVGQPFEEDMAYLGKIKAHRARMYAHTGLGDTAAAERARRAFTKVCDDLTWPDIICGKRQKG